MARWQGPGRVTVPEGAIRPVNHCQLLLHHCSHYPLPPTRSPPVMCHNAAFNPHRLGPGLGVRTGDRRVRVPTRRQPLMNFLVVVLPFVTTSCRPTTGKWSLVNCPPMKRRQRAELERSVNFRHMYFAK